MKQNELELVAHALDGNEEAYATLIDRYKEGSSLFQIYS